MGGFSLDKVIMIAVIAAILIGPERLPQAAEWLGRTTRRVRDYARGARTRVEEEVGDDFGEVDWTKLDPRQYDPRRIIREALLEDDAPAAAATAAAVRPPRTSPLIARTFSAEDPPPFDDEAT
ncbi:MAG TPA: twin-arginine translocase TatA/TatE family subunit [Candidatus Agrococcus pullicola]|uniref:Twin-arginine translocase TatA/TatE family subunit n=1 Tax=Candidatus Agrococcus pullicola TaxID=2838429 RepID=A0A9D1YUP5_9MICO|nr:twin-arginine translocase TatA/TatE family subunit [Candidatus Agrococcus pullicola]HJB63811.1 twin-arginine translocase TatA/TatE family subunit [Candidatus Microbacterium pullistercoris]